jgi:hypothetical protein
MARNNRLGDHSPYPMPPRYTGGSDDFTIVRRIDGHSPWDEEDGEDGNGYTDDVCGQNATSPNGIGYTIPVESGDQATQI